MSLEIVFRNRKNGTSRDFAVVRKGTLYFLAYAIGEEEESVVEIDPTMCISLVEFVALAAEILTVHDLVAEIVSEGAESEFWEPVRTLLKQPIGELPIDDPRVYLTAFGQNPQADQDEAWEYRAGAFDELYGTQLQEFRSKLESLETSDEELSFGNGHTLRYTAEKGFNLESSGMSAREVVILALIVATANKTESVFPEQSCPFLTPALYSAMTGNSVAGESHSENLATDSPIGPILSAVRAAAQAANPSAEKLSTGLPSVRAARQKLLDTLTNV